MSGRRLRGGAPEARSGGQAPGQTTTPVASATAPAKPAVPPQAGRVVGSGRRGSWWLLGPYLALTALFVLWPLIDAARLAFHQTYGARAEVWVGLDNLRFILNDRDFRLAVVNTLVFTVVSLAIQIPLALGLAVLVQESRARWAALARLILVSPQLTGPVFVGIIFSLFFMPRYGLINQVLHGLTGWGLELAWLQEPRLVMPALVLTNLWMWTGFTMIYFLAALQNVDKILLDAAKIDGADAWQRFRHVTLPAIRPVAVFVVVTSTIGALQLFELPFTLLKGFGPDNRGLSIVGYLYQHAFLYGDLGTGAAVGWVLTILIFVLGLVQIRMSGTLRKDG